MREVGRRVRHAMCATVPVIATRSLQRLSRNGREVLEPSGDAAERASRRRLPATVQGAAKTLNRRELRLADYLDASVRIGSIPWPVGEQDASCRRARTGSLSLSEITFQRLDRPFDRQPTTQIAGGPKAIRCLKREGAQVLARSKSGPSEDESDATAGGNLHERCNANATRA